MTVALERNEVDFALVQYLNTTYGIPLASMIGADFQYFIEAHGQVRSVVITKLDNRERQFETASRIWAEDTLDPSKSGLFGKKVAPVGGQNNADTMG
jgi:hypothetical protein